MTEVYEVVPGESIGPFRLGMTRAEVQALGIASMEEDENSIFYPLIDLKDAEPDRFKYPPWPGLRVQFNAEGRVRRLAAVFYFDPRPPKFALQGELLNGMTVKRARELVQEVARAAGKEGNPADLRAPGVMMSEFDSGDPLIMSVWVAALADYIEPR